MLCVHLVEVYVFVGWLESVQRLLRLLAVALVIDKAHQHNRVTSLSQSILKLFDRLKRIDLCTQVVGPQLDFGWRAFIVLE